MAKDHSKLGVRKAAKSARAAKEKVHTEPTAEATSSAKSDHVVFAPHMEMIPGPAETEFNFANGHVMRVPNAVASYVKEAMLSVFPVTSSPKGSHSEAHRESSNSAPRGSSSSHVAESASSDVTPPETIKSDNVKADGVPTDTTSPSFDAVNDTTKTKKKSKYLLSKMEPWQQVLTQQGDIRMESVILIPTMLRVEDAHRNRIVTSRADSVPCFGYNIKSIGDAEDLGHILVKTPETCVLVAPKLQNKVSTHLNVRSTAIRVEILYKNYVTRPRHDINDESVAA